LNLWLRCPLAFKAKYIDGIVPPPTPSLFVGKRVHDALEVFYRHRHLGIVDFGVEGAVKRVRDSWDQAAETEAMRFDSIQESEILRQQVIGLVTVYLEQMAGAGEIPLAVETSMEAPLVDFDTGADLGIPLTGIVDLVVDDRDGPLICDFKTAAKSAAPFEVTHEIQLSCYIGRLRAGRKAAWRSARWSKPECRKSSDTATGLAPTSTSNGCSP